MTPFMLRWKLAWSCVGLVQETVLLWVPEVRGHAISRRQRATALLIILLLTFCFFFFPSFWASVVWWWRAWHRSTIQAWPLSSHLFPGLWPRESLHRPQPATNRRFSCYSREQCWCGQFGIITRVVFNLKVKRCLSPFHYIVGISLTGRVPVSSVWQTLRFFPWELLICHSSRV